MKYNSLDLLKNGLYRIDELKLNRLSKHGENGYIVVSTNRSDIHSSNKKNDLTDEYINFLKTKNIEDTEEIRQKWLSQRNKICDKELDKRLRSELPYSFSSVFGGYHGTDNVSDSFEPSYIIFNYNKKGKPYESFDGLYKLALEICAEYKQDSVYVCKPNEAPIYVDRHGNQVNSTSSNDFKYNRDDEMFYTTTKRDKTNPQRFTADIQFENMFHKAGPSCYADRVKRGSQGEFFIGDVDKNDRINEEVNRFNEISNYKPR